MTDLIAKRIAARLDALNITARAASMRAGLGTDGVRNILRGKSESPRSQTLIKLAKALECSLEYLIGADGDVSDAPDIPAEGTVADLKVRRFAATRQAYWGSALPAAEALGITLPELLAIENGEKPIDDAYVMRFATLTGSPLDWLLLGRLTEPMKAELAARIALFDPALVSASLSEVEKPGEEHAKLPKKKSD